MTPAGQPGCHDFQAAINNVPNYVSGYQILFSPGVYPIPENLQTYSITIANKRGLIILGHNFYSRAATKLTFNQNRGGIHLVNSNVTIYNLTIEGTTTNGLIYAEADGTPTITLNHLILKDSGANTLVTNQLSSLTLENSKLSSSSVCLYHQNTPNLTVFQNHFINCGVGIEAVSSGGVISSNLFENIHDEGIFLTQTRLFSIHHNTLVNTPTSYGKYALSSNYHFSDLSSLNFDHNLIASSQGGIFINTPAYLHYNFVNNNISTSGPRYTGIADQTGINGNITYQPSFGGHDYCLTPNSPELLSDGNFMGHYGDCSRYEWSKDFNNDQINSLFDLNYLINRFPSDDRNFKSTDLDEDGDVDYQDYHQLLQYLVQ